MLKALPGISKKIMVIMVVILFAVSVALFISPGKIYGAVPVVNITVTSAGGVLTVAVGGTLQMIATVLPAEADSRVVTWSVVNIENTATIDAVTGVLTGEKVGAVRVVATATDAGISGSKTITVTAPVPVDSINVTGAGNATTVLNGSTLIMSASVLPIDATNQGITWSVTAGTGNATINAESGVLTATGVGSVTVAATAKDSSTVIGTYLITITAPIPPAAAPTASAVSITGTAQVGQTLTGSYTYADVNDDIEGPSTFKWLASDTSDGIYAAISGATSKTFLLTSDQLSKIIRFEVTPAALTGDPLTGTAATSAAITIVLPPAAPGDNPTIGGTLIITAPASQQSSVTSNAAPVTAVYEKTIPGFVTLFYNRILGRTPDPKGFNGWVAGLASGILTGSNLVKGFIFSAENLGITSGDTNEKFITSLYSLVFDRAPDAGGLKSWLANMSAGMTKEEVISHFTSSAEFINLCAEYGVKP
jgi:hypothetical protein